MPLALVTIGTKCVVKSFDCSVAARMRMVNMGFIPGRSIAVMSRINGTLLVQLGQSRIMIDGCLANQIRVS